MVGIKRKKLGQLLLESNTLRVDQLQMALEHQRRWGGKLASVLIEMGIIDEKTVAPFLEEQTGWKCIPLENMRIAPEVITMLKPETVKKYHIIPLYLEKKTLTIATANPVDYKTFDELSFLSGLTIKPMLAVESSIHKAINSHYFNKDKAPREPRTN